MRRSCIDRRASSTGTAAPDRSCGPARRRVPDHLVRQHLMLRDDIGRQRAEHGHLRVRIRVPAPVHQRQVFVLRRKAEIDDLDADRARIEHPVALPVADARVPCAARLRHELEYLEAPAVVGRVGHQIVRADLPLRARQRGDRIRERLRGVMQHERAHPRILVRRLDRAIDRVTGARRRGRILRVRGRHDAVAVAAAGQRQHQHPHRPRRRTREKPAPALVDDFRLLFFSHTLFRSSRNLRLRIGAMRRASRLRDDATRERGSPRRRASSDSECDVFLESGSASKRTRCRGGGCGEDVPGVDVSRERLAACGRLCRSARPASKSSGVVPSDQEGGRRLTRAPSA